jgi:formylglycine-generating enzyme required for sulfatase activity
MRNFRRRNLMMKRLLVLAALLFAFPAHAEVNIEWVTVGDPGNACETQVGPPPGCYGAVAYPYRISKYEVTNSQYVEFLNAVAATDTNGLYSLEMDTIYDRSITQDGIQGSYTYGAVAGREEIPVAHVSFYDALRFANWLHNGQPTGAQDDTTTEDSAYDMSLGDSVVRRAGARVVLPNEDEWYKAAYFNGTSYFDYPAGSDTETTCAMPGTTSNTANCSPVVGELTDVGSYTGSASPSGTFDQGGNVSEWNEAIIGSNRDMRGGSFFSTASKTAAASRESIPPTWASFTVGFRVVSLAPSVPAPSPVGLLLVAAGLLGFGGYRRGRA